MTKRSIWKECALVAVAIFACATQAVAQSDTYVVTVPSACALTVTTNPLQVSANTCAPVTIKCGAPEFNCSPKSTGVAVAPPLPPMPNINSTGYAYKNPGDFYYPLSGLGGCYTALTDLHSGLTGSAHASLSGGAGNNMSDVLRAYFALTDDGGSLRYFHGFYDAFGCLQRDSATLSVSPSGGTKAGFTFARLTPGRAYKIAPAGKEKAGDATTGTNLYQEDTSYSPVTHVVGITRTLLFNYNHCPGVNGTSTTQGGNGNLNVDSNDRFFSTTLNFPPAPAGQDNAHWALVWDRQTNRCSVYYTGQILTAENPAKGNIWGWCSTDPSDPITHGNCSQNGSNPAPPALNTTCDPAGYGVHDSIQMMNGLYMNISGKCIHDQAGQSTVWRFGTNDIRHCSTTVYNCGGHGAFGYNMGWSYNNNIAHRDNSDLTTWTVVRPLLPAGVDEHGAANWTGSAADVNPWIASSGPNIVSNSCSTLPYCNELLAIKLDGTIARLGPNFHLWTGAGNDLGPIMSMTQDAYCILFESTWNHTRGLDADGNYHKDLFSYCRPM